MIQPTKTTLFRNRKCLLFEEIFIDCIVRRRRSSLVIYGPQDSNWELVGERRAHFQHVFFAQEKLPIVNKSAINRIIINEMTINVFYSIYDLNGFEDILLIINKDIYENKILKIISWQNDRKIQQ